MNHIKQHLPAFVDGEPKEADFNTTDELLAIPFVAAWTDQDWKRFSMSDELLLAETKSGEHWVVGFIREPAQVQLPAWAGRKT